MKSAKLRCRAGLWLEIVWWIERLFCIMPLHLEFLGRGCACSASGVLPAPVRFVPLRVGALNVAANGSA